MSPRAIACVAALAATMLAANAAGDKSVPAPNPIKKLKGKQSFWSWLAEPHSVEIDIILERARTNLQLARGGMPPFSWSSGAFQPQTAKERDRALDEALGMLRYARRLSPKNRRVLAMIADVAVFRGANATALDALETLAALPDRSGREVFVRHVPLGMVLARLGRWDEAQAALSRGITERSFAPEYRQAVFTLALVDMERGRLAEAIDLLESVALPFDAHVQLALAVAYDRGEQESAASRILAQLTANQTLGAALANHSGTHEPIRFTPSADRAYFTALALEAGGHLGAARAAWADYARVDPPARYRDRALAHIADIDALPQPQPATKAAKPAPTRPARARP